MGQYIQRPDNGVTFRNFFRGIAEALPKLAEMYVQYDVMRDQREYRNKLYNLELSKYDETKANNKANRNLTAEHTTKIKNENTITKGTMKLAIKTQNMQAELTQLMVELESVAKDNPEYRGLYAKASSADLKTKIEGLNELIARIDQTKKEAANTEQYGKIMAVQEQLAKLEVVAKGMAFLTQNMTEEGAIAFMDKYGGQTFGDESQMLQVVLEKGNFSPSLFAHTQTMFDAMMKVRQDESAQIANWDAKHIMPDPEIESNKEAFAQWQADRNQFMGELEQQYGKLHDYFIGKFETMTGEEFPRGNMPSVQFQQNTDSKGWFGGDNPFYKGYEAIEGVYDRMGQGDVPTEELFNRSNAPRFGNKGAVRDKLKIAPYGAASYIGRQIGMYGDNK